MEVTDANGVCRPISKELLATRVREQAGGKNELFGAAYTEQLKAEKILIGSISASIIPKTEEEIK